VKRKIIILPDAQADIQGIWDDGAREHGVDAANRYVIRLDQSMQMALKHPDIGTDYSSVRAGYRKLASGQHLIFYIPHEGGIDVIRVLHGRMDVRSRLGD
jgi:toxin ParE1/3/4